MFTSLSRKNQWERHLAAIRILTTAQLNSGFYKNCKNSRFCHRARRRIGSKSRAYTEVREYFEAIRNAAIWRNMEFLVVVDEPIDELSGNADPGGNPGQVVFCKPGGVNDFGSIKADFTPGIIGNKSKHQ